MRLEKLEVNGFKSFAKTTVLEFPSRVTAIVGPNGSGKSNIVESLRWVFGEQSIKSLRGKKGEDLIWNGSPLATNIRQASAPRMGKASVSLVFDNTDRAIPLDFEKVIIKRTIFREGASEYYLNNSLVRLKDIVELMARLGLGETKHNIINQGEVDRMLLATPRERRQMLEEALGLRVYQIKKNDAQRKLAACETNMRQVEALVREIAPHVRFLREQAKKAQARGSMEAELRTLEKIYFSREQAEIRKEREKIRTSAEPLVARADTIKKELTSLTQAIADAEEQFAGANTNGKDEQKFFAAEQKRRALERELGRLEGRLELERERVQKPQTRATDIRDIRDSIMAFLSEIRSILEGSGHGDSIRTEILVLIEGMEKLLADTKRGFVEVKKGGGQESPVIHELADGIRAIQDKIAVLGKEIETHSLLRKKDHKNVQEARERMRGLYHKMRTREDTGREIARERERLNFEEERVALREQAFLDYCAASGINRNELPSVILD